MEMLVFMKNLAGVKFDRVAVEAAAKDLASADAQMSKARLLRPTRPGTGRPQYRCRLGHCGRQTARAAELERAAGGSESGLGAIGDE
jgi:hypothetical protein